jgi:hypothetical protein
VFPYLNRVNPLGKVMGSSHRERSDIWCCVAEPKKEFFQTASPEILQVLNELESRVILWNYPGDTVRQGGMSIYFSGI